MSEVNYIIQYMNFKEDIILRQRLEKQKILFSFNDILDLKILIYKEFFQNN